MAAEKTLSGFGASVRRFGTGAWGEGIFHSNNSPMEFRARWRGKNPEDQVQDQESRSRDETSAIHPIIDFFSLAPRFIGGVSCWGL
jgi:hypothetical protein